MQYTKPKVYIPRNLFNKIQFYVDNCDKEIGGLGVVEIHPEENAYIVKKIVLLKQTVTGSTTDLDEDDTALEVYKHATSGEAGELCFWWHSHVNMNVFWSATDRDTIETMGATGLCVATVHNKKGEVRAAIKEVNANGMSHFYDDVPLTIIETYDFNVAEALEEMKEKVIQKVWTYNHPASNTTTNNKGKGSRRALSVREEQRLWDGHGEFYDDEYDSVARLVAMHNSTDFNDDSLALTDKYQSEAERRYAELEALNPNPKRLGYDELVVDTTYRVMKTEEYSIVTGKQIGRASCRERVSSPV